MTNESEQRHPWLQFRLRSLLVIILFSALVLGWYADRNRLAKKIEELTAKTSQPTTPYVLDYTKKEYRLTWRGFDGHDSKHVIYVLDGIDIGRHGEGLGSLAGIIDRIPRGSRIDIVVELFRTPETPFTNNPLTISPEFQQLISRAEKRDVHFVFPDGIY